MKVSIGGHRSAVDWTAAVRMGNVPNTVKHCLSYEQLIQDYPWLRRWPLEEKVGVVFLVSNLLHMLCHMTLSWQRGCTAASHWWQLMLHAAYIMVHFSWDCALLLHITVFLRIHGCIFIRTCFISLNWLYETGDAYLIVCVVASSAGLFCSNLTRELLIYLCCMWTNRLPTVGFYIQILFTDQTE